jgi:hypothetical protein
MEDGESGEVGVDMVDMMWEKGPVVDTFNDRWDTFG